MRHEKLIAILAARTVCWCSVLRIGTATRCWSSATPPTYASAQGRDAREGDKRDAGCAVARRSGPGVGRAGGAGCRARGWPRGAGGGQQSTYAHIGRLPNPEIDAADMSSALRRLGFEVTVEFDADRVELTEALRAFTRRSAGADVKLVFYAGHAVADLSMAMAATTSSREGSSSTTRTTRR